MSMCFLHQLQRYYHTVKYFNLRQITYRFWFSLKYPFYKKFTPLVDWIYRWKVRHADRDFKIDAKEKENAQLPCELSGTEHSSRREEKAEEILKNRFNFLNAEIQFGREIDWDTQQASKLWRYNLHYFAYAIDLAIAYKRTSRTEFYAQFKTLVLDWIQNNSIAHGDGWEPYPISLRTVNWIFAHALFDKDGSIGNIGYFANGDKSFPKERVEIFGNDSVAVIDDFNRGEIVTKGKRKKLKGKFLGGQDKGHRAELEAFVQAVKSGGEMPIPFQEIVMTTLTTFKMVESIRKGAPVEIPSL